MSRVHDALRRAGQNTNTAVAPPTSSPKSPNSPTSSNINRTLLTPEARQAAYSFAESKTGSGNLQGLLDQVAEIPFAPLADSLLIDPLHNHDAPTEEFRTLRTRLNHIQTQSAIHSVVVTSPSPAEGKSFAAANLALAQAQLAGNMVLL